MVGQPLRRKESVRTFPLFLGMLSCSWGCLDYLWEVLGWKAGVEECGEREVLIVAVRLWLTVLWEPFTTLGANAVRGAFPF
jgi:hypothetical protein